MENYISGIKQDEFYEKYWKYYLLLEKEFFDLSYYVSIDFKKNGKTYSLAYLKLLLSIGSEFDVVCKKICKLLDKEFDDSKCGIDNYKEVFKEQLGKLYEYDVVTIEEKELIPKPLKNMNTQFPPNFWSSYNKVKHHRTDDDNIKEANQKTVLTALSSLYIVERIFAFINSTSLGSYCISMPAEFNFNAFKSNRLYIKEFDGRNVYKLGEIFREIKKKAKLIIN